MFAVPNVFFLNHRIVIHMRKSLLLTGLLILCAQVCLSQSAAIPLSQAAPSQQSTLDCSDPSVANSVQCSAQNQSVGGATDRGGSSLSTPVLNSPTGGQDRYVPTTPPLNPSQIRTGTMPVRPETEFEQMVADSVGRALPLFGQSLFLLPPSTFAPVDWMQVPSDYILGPGDELQVRIWGQVEANLRVSVDRSGQIYIPQVGQVSVAGLHYGELEDHLKTEVAKNFKNFHLTANIGRLRSIQVLVVGNARYPGTYTISSLSSLVNAIFASGGPSAQGSLRHIQVRRDRHTISDFDFYDLLIKGDKSKDVRLQPGDVIYIPHVGPLVAIAGSVNTPAIYEMRDDSTLNDLVEIAGDLSTVADTGKITVDRVVDHQARKTLEFPYDQQARALPLKDGDIVRVLSIVPRFEDTVTLRGNVANPGRYAWKPGMRVRDLIPDSQALLTRGYWRNRASIVIGNATEYPIQERLHSGNAANNQRNSVSGPADTTPQGFARAQDPDQNSSTPEDLQDANGSAGLAGVAADETSVDAAQSSNGESASSGNQPSMQNQGGISESNSVMTKNVVEDVRRNAPEINWDYAIIQRVNPVDLTSKLIWMSPRKAVLERDEQSNLELEAGDIVTIFSQRDISVPQSDRSQYVILEGEVMRPGVYKLENNETLRSILLRAGGLTPDAYVYGAQFTRDSARKDQQKSLDELARSMEVQIRQTAVSAAASIQPGDVPQMLTAQEAIISQLRSTRATGRVALPVKPRDKTLTDFPDMVMEDNDRLIIPHTPSTVSVIGDVYNPGSFIFDPHNSAGAYLQIAGKGKPQSDLHHAFVLRANGVVVAANDVNGPFVGSKFNRLRLYPGDQIIVPYKLPTGAFVRGLRDWTQVSSQLALTAAAVAILK